MAVLLAKTRSALALIAISVCKAMLPQCPPRSEISCEEWIGFANTLSGSNRVENIVNSGLVKPTVSTTSARAIPMTFFLGALITGESWEILSKPEKARNEAAKPIRIVAGVSAWFTNMAGNRERN